MNLELLSRFDSTALELQPFSSLPGGDYLNAKEQTIICTTNIVGAMGKGIALSTKIKWPYTHKVYMKLYKKGVMDANFLCNVRVGLDKYVLLFPTKKHWRHKSNVDQIITNLDKLEDGYEKLNITSLAIPPLGMGNGWLDNKESVKVIERINTFASSIEIPCTFYYD